MNEEERLIFLEYLYYTAIAIEANIRCQKCTCSFYDMLLTVKNEITFWKVASWFFNKEKE